MTIMILVGIVFDLILCYFFIIRCEKRNNDSNDIECEALYKEAHSSIYEETVKGAFIICDAWNMKGDYMSTNDNRFSDDFWPEVNRSLSVHERAIYPECFKIYKN